MRRYKNMLVVASIALLLVACREEKLSITLENDSEDIIHGAHVIWGNHVVPIARESRITTPGGTVFSEISYVEKRYYLPEYATAKWINAKGERQEYKIPIRPEEFPELAKGEEYSNFRIGFYQGHAVLTVKRWPRRPEDEEDWLKELERARTLGKNFLVRERERMRPYLEEAQRDYAGWVPATADGDLSRSLRFDYQRGNELAKLYIYDQGLALAIAVDGEGILQRDNLDGFVRAFTPPGKRTNNPAANLDRINRVKGFKKILDIRFFSSPHYSIENWSLMKVAKENGFEVRISEFKERE